MTSKPELALTPSNGNKPTAAVGPGAGLVFVQSYFPGAATIRIASAYFSLKGYMIGREHVHPEVRFHVLVGREEGTNVRKAVVEEIHAELRGCETNLWESVNDLVHRMKQGRFTIRDARSMEVPFHCKFYICDDVALWHGSVNYSRNGLISNAEQVTAVTGKDEISVFTKWFDTVSQDAKDLLSELIALLEQWLALASPFDVYLQILLRMSSIPEPKLGPGAHAPTYYQKAVIARALRQIDNFGGALIVLTTGLGKTVIGAEIAHRLTWAEHVNHVILLAPNGVREFWDEELNERGLHPWFFSSDVLFRRDSRKRHHLVHQLTKRLKDVDESTLIIVDEAHFYKNQILSQRQKQQPSRVFERLVPAVKAGAKIVLLTATAYGTSIRNFQSLLHLLPHRRPGRLDVLGPWEAETPDEFTKLPVVTILGLPDVLALARRREDVDSEGRPFIPVGKDRRYLPTAVRLVPVTYELPLQSEIQRLFDASYFSYAAKLPLKGFDDDRGDFDSVTDAGVNAALNSWMSSPAAMKEYLEHSIGRENESQQLTLTENTNDSPMATVEPLAGTLPPDPQLELLPEISVPSKGWGYEKASARYLIELERRRELIEPISEKLDPVPDHKLQSLFRIIRETCGDHGGKVLVFVKLHSTALYLERNLQKMFGNLTIGCTVQEGRDAPTLKARHSRDEILRQFSPGAYGYVPDQEIDVLICTDADGVGVNLQDADTVVNYDPPSAADVLFQRAGRVLRMTSRADRTVTIYTFLPTLAHDENPVGVSAHIHERFARLNRRHDRSRRIIGGPMLSNSEEIDWMKEVRIDVEQWFREGDLASSLVTGDETSLAAHMTLLEEYRERAEKLIVPLHSAMVSYRFATPHVAACFEHDGDVRLILYNLREDRLEPLNEYEILDVLKCGADEPRASVRCAEVEQAANRAVQLWCETSAGDIDRAKKVCAMYLQPVTEEAGFRKLLLGS